MKNTIILIGALSALTLSAQAGITKSVDKEAAILQKYDTDKDGELSEEETKAMEAAIKAGKKKKTTK